MLWRAQKQEGYCEQKTQEFIRQLAGWGWNCAQAAASEEVAEPEEADDTGALTPEEESAEIDEVEATE